MTRDQRGNHTAQDCGCAVSPLVACGSVMRSARPSDQVEDSGATSIVAEPDAQRRFTQGQKSSNSAWHESLRPRDSGVGAQVVRAAEVRDRDLAYD
jgi:hypothetical protein